MKFEIQGRDAAPWYHRTCWPPCAVVPAALASAAPRPAGCADERLAAPAVHAARVRALGERRWLPAASLCGAALRAAAKAARRRGGRGWVPGWGRASSTEHREVSRDPHREEERGRVLDRSRRLCAVRPTGDCPSRRPSGMGWKGRSREGGRISGFLLQWATSGLNYFEAPTVIRRRN